MNFPRYERYKDSGVEWLGEIPEHWGLNRLKYLAKLRLSNIDKHSRSNETPVSLCNYTDVYYQDLITEDLDFMLATASEEQIKKFSLERGDILITKDSETPDDIAVPAYIPKSLPGVVCGYHLAYIKPSQIQGKYLFYAFKAINFVSQFHIAATGITRYGIGKDDIGNALFLVPPIAEQERIAEFLDRKCGEIDEAIAKKQRLIELLDEQKTILINQAVTKGLNPDAPMKDSGSQFFSCLHKDFSLVRLGYLCRKVIDGPHFSPNYLETGYMFISARNIRPGKWLLGDAKFISKKDYQEFSKRVKPEKGDVLYTKGGTTGVAKVVDLGIPFQVWVHIAVLKLHMQKVLPKYLEYALNSYGCYQQSQLYTRGATNKDLGLTRMINILIPTPTLEEQASIVLFLNKATKSINQAVSKANQQIQNLRELKQVLIAEAVTGKIKV
jgi:type I restriction enzyme S subunit